VSAIVGPSFNIGANVAIESSCDSNPGVDSVPSVGWLGLTACRAVQGCPTNQNKRLIFTMLQAANIQQDKKRKNLAKLRDKHKELVNPTTNILKNGVSYSAKKPKLQGQKKCQITISMKEIEELVSVVIIIQQLPRQDSMGVLPASSEQRFNGHSDTITRSDS
jgi:hypothetical protein